MNGNKKFPLPVNKRLHALMGTRDELSHNLKSFYKIKVKEVMERDFLKFKRQNDLLDLLREFKDPKITSAVIVDEENHLLGLVTQKSLLKFFKMPQRGAIFGTSILERIKTSRSSLMKDIMTEDPVTIEENETLDEAIRLMIETGKHHLPVLNKEKKVEGVLETGDIMILLRIVTL